MSVIAHNGKVVVSGGKTLNFDNLIALANNTTGETDTTLTDAVQSLVDGFGGGGSGLIHGREFETGTFTVASKTSDVLVAYQSHSKNDIPSGAIFWTEDDFFNDTTDNWFAFSAAIYWGGTNYYGVLCNASTGGPTFVRYYPAGKTQTLTAGNYNPPNLIGQQVQSTIFGCGFYGNACKLGGGNGKFKPGATYKYIIFWGE